MEARPEVHESDPPGVRDLRLDSEIPSVDFQPAEETASPQQGLSPEEPRREEEGATEGPEKELVLSPEEKANLGLVILIRFLVMSQPIFGLFSVSVTLLLFFAIRSVGLMFVLPVCIPVYLYLFSVYELRQVSGHTARNRCFALFYNAGNKLLYCLLLLALHQVHRSPGHTGWAVGAGLLICVQTSFYLTSLIYKRKQQIDQYVGSAH